MSGAAAQSGRSDTVLLQINSASGEKGPDAEVESMRLMLNQHMASMKGAQGPRGMAGLPGPVGPTGHGGLKGEPGEPGEPVSQITPTTGNWTAR